MQRAADAALAHRCEKTFAAAVTHFLCGNDSYSDQTAAAAAAPALALSLFLSPLGYCQTSRRLIILVRFHLLPLGLTLIVALPSMGFRFFFFFLECVWGAHQFVMSSIVGLCFCDLRDTVFIRMS